MTRELPSCPEWCDLKPGHDWGTDWQDGRLSRGHGSKRADWNPPDDKAGVEIYSIEFTDGSSLGPALEVWGADELSAGRARQHAAAVLAAAAELDRILGSV